MPHPFGAAHFFPTAGLPGDPAAAIGREFRFISSRDSGYELGGTPDFERYDERFNPETGTGEMEIWVPVKAKP